MDEGIFWLLRKLDQFLQKKKAQYFFGCKFFVSL